MTAQDVLLHAASGATLAQNNFGDTRSGGLAGPMGLFIIVILVIATVLLIRNMNTRIRRLPDRFPDQGEHGRDAGTGADRDAAPDDDAIGGPK